VLPTEIFLADGSQQHNKRMSATRAVSTESESEGSMMMTVSLTKTDCNPDTRTVSRTLADTTFLKVRLICNGNNLGPIIGIQLMYMTVVDTAAVLFMLCAESLKGEKKRCS
jgi:hypothetical protein